MVKRNASTMYSWRVLLNSGKLFAVGEFASKTINCQKQMRALKKNFKLFFLTSINNFQFISDDLRLKNLIYFQFLKIFQLFSYQKVHAIPTKPYLKLFIMLNRVIMEIVCLVQFSSVWMPFWWWIFQSFSPDSDKLVIYFGIIDS